MRSFPQLWKTQWKNTGILTQNVENFFLSVRGKRKFIQLTHGFAHDFTKK